MTERELFKELKKTYPGGSGTSFMVRREHWYHDKDNTTFKYSISILNPVVDCHIIYSEVSWQDLHSKWAVWRRAQKGA